jgi:hypothetical protein
VRPLPSRLRLTPQFSGRALRSRARSKRIMQWRACCAPAIRYHGPLQLLVMRHSRCGNMHHAVVRPRDSLGARAVRLYCVPYVSAFPFVSKNVAKGLQSVMEVAAQSSDS